MRLATLQPQRDSPPVAAVAAADESWLTLFSVLRVVLGEVPTGASWMSPLEELLPAALEQREELTAWLADWPRHVATFSATGGRAYPPATPLLPPVVRPPAFRDFYAFEQHVKTCRARRGQTMPPAWYEVPAFYFSNARALVGNGAPVFAPAGAKELDYELELGVVIGRGGRDIPAARAWEHVAGLTIVNDLSARDLQRAEMSVGLGPAKGKDFATAAGPWLVTRDEFADRIDGERLQLAMRARKNGRELSRGDVAALHHSIPRLIAHASRDAELFPGDLIATGTVGTGCILELGPENTGGWLMPGDEVELEIERLGVLRTPIVARP
ncbi:MAG TPA: fumarylacetoacetate hydrolase family protein [Opitutaceae bacterium]